MRRTIVCTGGGPGRATEIARYMQEGRPLGPAFLFSRGQGWRRTRSPAQPDQLRLGGCRSVVRQRSRDGLRDNQRGEERTVGSIGPAADASLGRWRFSICHSFHGSIGAVPERRHGLSRQVHAPCGLRRGEGNHGACRSVAREFAEAGEGCTGEPCLVTGDELIAAVPSKSALPRPARDASRVVERPQMLQGVWAL